MGPGERRHLAGEPSTVEPDERGHGFRGCRGAGVGERGQPGRDPRLDGVDERAIEVEHDGAGERKSGE